MQSIGVLIKERWPEATYDLLPQGEKERRRCADEQCSTAIGSPYVSTPMMSLSFMIRSSSPSSLTSVPDHLPNSTRSPTLTPIGISLPASSRPPGPIAITSPCDGFSLAVSGMMMPPLVFSSASMRLTTTRSCSGRNLDLAMTFPLEGSVFRVWSTVESGSEYGRIRHRQGAKQLAILSNRALGVLIVHPGIWLDADPVKQPG